jgi:hypothetical protein
LKLQGQSVCKSLVILYDEQCLLSVDHHASDTGGRRAAQAPRS